MRVRSNQPASLSAMAIVSGSSPVAHGTLQMRIGRSVVARDERRQHRLHEALNLRDLAPEVGLLHRQRVHDSPPFAARRALVVLQEVVEVEKGPEAALDDERARCGR